MGRDLLARIEAPHFVAGLVLRRDRVIAAAPIVAYMARGNWTRDRAWHYCSAKGWRVRIVEGT